MSEEATKKGVKVQALLILLLLVSLAGNAFLGSIYWQARQEIADLKTDPETIAKEELEEVIAEVSKLIALPEGVTPVLATVNDAENLKTRQPFFASAENGDKVLLYTNASDTQQRKAYLYRPSSKQLLNVAPINIGGNTIQQQQDEFSMEIRNGTQTDKLEDRMQTLLSQVFPKAKVPSKGNASRRNFEKSILVKVNASDELANKVANLFNVQVVTLPSGEVDPGEVDLLLILGGTQQEEGSSATPSPVATAQPTATPAQ